jgi:hypothetical protein
MNHPITTFENYLSKKSLYNMEKQQKVYKQRGDVFEVHAAPILTPSPSNLSEGGGNRTPELAGTLATAASFRSGGGGRGFRSRGGPTYLV